MAGWNLSCHVLQRSPQPWSVQTSPPLTWILLSFPSPFNMGSSTVGVILTGVWLLGGSPSLSMRSRGGKMRLIRSSKFKVKITFQWIVFLSSEEIVLNWNFVCFPKASILITKILGWASPWNHSGVLITWVQSRNWITFWHLPKSVHMQLTWTTIASVMQFVLFQDQGVEWWYLSVSRWGSHLSCSFWSLSNEACNLFSPQELTEIQVLE